MSVDISVIVPLFNAEKFIRVCINSVLAQTFGNFEVLIVDDCSADGGVELCRELYGKDERVRIILQPQNSGAGAARNRGLSEARGKYIAFIDSDDQMGPDYLGDMFRTAEKFDADVVHNTHCFFVMPPKGQAIPLEMLTVPAEQFINFASDRRRTKELTMLTGDLASRLDEWVKHSYHFSIWNNLYKKSFLTENDIRFGKMRLAEDAVFFMQCLFMAGRFVVRPGGGYVYRVTDASLSRGGKSPESALKAMRSQVEAVWAMKGIAEKIPFFRDNPANITRALDAVLLDLEEGFIKPTFQTLGEDGMRSGGSVHAFFTEIFGENTPYIEFLFYELHKAYPPVIDYVEASRDPEKAREINNQ
ncbi:MAG: glycosyltransferase [Synergistaceae bacterium]|nr:glycosyltransferase [Synergistaceae bacterium]